MKNESGFRWGVICEGSGFGRNEGFLGEGWELGFRDGPGWGVLNVTWVKGFHRGVVDFWICTRQRESSHV